MVLSQIVETISAALKEKNPDQTVVIQSIELEQSPYELYAQVGENEMVYQINENDEGIDLTEVKYDDEDGESETTEEVVEESTEELEKSDTIKKDEVLNTALKLEKSEEVGEQTTEATKEEETEETDKPDDNTEGGETFEKAQSSDMMGADFQDFEMYGFIDS